MLYEGEFFQGKNNGFGREYDNMVYQNMKGYRNGECYGFGKKFPGANSAHYINGISE